MQSSLNTYRERIEKLFGDHPDADLFGSLPGTGEKLAPRLLSHFGTNRQRFESACSAQQLSGTAPVTQKSGQRKHVKFRPDLSGKDFRNTMQQFAFQSLKKSVWARAFYDKARESGQSHDLALRNLAGKWIKIIYRIWQDHQPHDEARYLASLIRRRSPLVQAIQNT